MRTNQWKTFLISENRFVQKCVLFLLPFLWMGFIFYLSSIPSLELKGQLAIFDFVLRKTAHMIEFGILTILWKLNMRNTWLAIILSVLWAIIDEVHQSFVPMREGKVEDVVIDGVGIVIAIFIYNIKFKMKNDKSMTKSKF